MYYIGVKRQGAVSYYPSIDNFDLKRNGVSLLKNTGFEDGISPWVGFRLMLKNGQEVNQNWATNQVMVVYESCAQGIEITADQLVWIWGFVILFILLFKLILTYQLFTLVSFSWGIDPWVLSMMTMIFFKLDYDNFAWYLSQKEGGNATIWIPSSDFYTTPLSFWERTLFSLKSTLNTSSISSLEWIFSPKAWRKIAYPASLSILPL